MSINLTAHDTLKVLCGERFVKTREYGRETYEVQTYMTLSFEKLRDRLPKYSPKEIRFALIELESNGHSEMFSNQFRATESGDLALQKKFYINADNKEQAENSDNFLKRHWIWNMVISATIGAVIGSIVTLAVNSITQSRATSQTEDSPIKPTVDIDSVKGEVGKNDSTTTEKK